MKLYNVNVLSKISAFGQRNVSIISHIIHPIYQYQLFVCSPPEDPKHQAFSVEQIPKFWCKRLVCLIQVYLELNYL